MTNGDAGGGPIGELKGLAQLLSDYARQETLQPLKRAGAYVAYGLVGSLLLAFGLLFLLFALLRALQDEAGSWTTGSLSWAPYLITIIVGVVLMFLSIRAISSGSKGKAS